MDMVNGKFSSDDFREILSYVAEVGTSFRTVRVDRTVLKNLTILAIRTQIADLKAEIRKLEEDAEQQQVNITGVSNVPAWDVVRVAIANFTEKNLNFASRKELTNELAFDRLAVFTESVKSALDTLTTFQMQIRGLNRVIDELNEILEQHNKS